jgi:hypothetical protein
MVSKLLLATITWYYLLKSEAMEYRMHSITLILELDKKKQTARSLLYRTFHQKQNKRHALKSEIMSHCS